MAFNRRAFNVGLQTLGGGALRVHSYATTDTRATVSSTGYFVDISSLGVREGDFIVVQDLVTKENYGGECNDIDSNGDGTIEWESKNTQYAPEHFGAKGDQETDDLDAILAVIDRYNAVWLTDGRSYKIGEFLHITESNKFVLANGRRGGIYMAAAVFNNTALSPGARYLGNSAGICIHGLKTTPYTPIENVRIIGVKVESQVADSRVVDGITAQNVKNLIIEDCEIFGLPMGVGIRAASLSGQSRIANNIIRDITSNVTWIATPQLGAIEVDNDRVNDGQSDDLEIILNRIRDVTGGATFIASHGNQADGINTQGLSAKNILIAWNRIHNTGDGIDHFGTFSKVLGNRLSDCSLSGIKLIHGANNNEYAQNTIDGAGLGGFMCSGSSSSGNHTEKNWIHHNRVRRIDYNAVYAGSGPACVYTQGGDPGVFKDNLFEHNEFDGSTGEYCIRRGDGQTNDFPNNDFTAGTLGLISDTSRAGIYTNRRRAYIEAFLSAAGIDVGTGVAVALILDSEVKDTQAEYNPANGEITVKLNGRRRISGRLRVGSVTAASTVTLTVRVNGTAVMAFDKYLPDALTQEWFSFSHILNVLAGDEITLDVKHTDGDAITVVHGTDSTYGNRTYIQVEELD